MERALICVKKMESGTFLVTRKPIIYAGLLKTISPQVYVPKTCSFCFPAGPFCYTTLQTARSWSLFPLCVSCLCFLSRDLFLLVTTYVRHVSLVVAVRFEGWFCYLFGRMERDCMWKKKKRGGKPSLTLNRENKVRCWQFHMYRWGWRMRYCCRSRWGWFCEAAEL